MAEFAAQSAITTSLKLPLKAVKKLPRKVRNYQSPILKREALVSTSLLIS